MVEVMAGERRTPPAVRGVAHARAALLVRAERRAMTPSAFLLIRCTRQLTSANQLTDKRR